MNENPELPTDSSEAGRITASTSREVRATKGAEYKRGLTYYEKATHTLAEQIRPPQILQEQLSAHLAIVNQLGMNVRRSLDISGLTRLSERLDTSRHALRYITQHWEESMQRPIDYSAFQKAAAEATAAFDTAAISQANAALDQYLEVFKDISTQIGAMLADIDVSHLFEQFDRFIPSNLRGVRDLEAVASLALDEGIPLCWVPRAEIVTALIEASGPVERQHILNERRDEILDDCETVLRSIPHEWSVQCRNAIEALRQGYDGPAQSHASNIIDSIVATGPGRQTAVDRARDEFEELPMYLITENLVLRPLVRALARWYPNSGDPPPMHFARHVTSHAVGYTGVFNPLYALIGIMLATSLIVQYSPSPRGDNDTNDAIHSASTGDNPV